MVFQCRITLVLFREHRLNLRCLHAAFAVTSIIFNINAVFICFIKVYSVSCASVLGSLYRIQRTTIKLLQKQKHLSKSWQAEKLVRFLINVKKQLLFLCPFLSDYIFISPAIFNWKWKFLLNFLLIKLWQRQITNFQTYSIAA